MHMGHAFSNSQQDFIARYKRMQNFNVLQPLGTDDNGLPTMLLIQKLKKVRANSMERKEFRKLVVLDWTYLCIFIDEFLFKITKK